MIQQPQAQAVDLDLILLDKGANRLLITLQTCLTSTASTDDTSVSNACSFKKKYLNNEERVSEGHGRLVYSSRVSCKSSVASSRRFHATSCPAVQNFIEADGGILHGAVSFFRAADQKEDLCIGEPNVTVRAIQAHADEADQFTGVVFLVG